MRRFFDKLNSVPRVLVAALVLAIGVNTYSIAQQFVFNNPVIVGHFINGGSGTALQPVGTGCTIAAGSADTDGSCTASAASGSIVFATAFSTPPFCVIADQSATSTVSMPVYSVSASTITLTTIISTHVLNWHCAARVGG